MAATNSAQKLCVAESSFKEISSAPSGVRIKFVRAMRFILFVRRGLAAWKDSSNVWGSSRPGGGREALDAAKASGIFGPGTANADDDADAVDADAVDADAGSQLPNVPVPEPKCSESFRVLAGRLPSVVATAIGAPGATSAAS